jgi:hypothetical protein
MYQPPTLQESQSVPIVVLSNRHRGQTCYIVGKGASLINLRAHHFGPGPVITLNSAIGIVDDLGLPNQVYAMQKDGCSSDDPDNYHRPCDSCHLRDFRNPPLIDPRPGVAVLFSRYYSSWCFHGRRNRFVFTEDELGFVGEDNYKTMSILCSIPIARGVFGCEHLVFMCCDSLAFGGKEYLEKYPAHLAQGAADALDWAKPRVMSMLKYIPHSFFTPQP